MGITRTKLMKLQAAIEAVLRAQDRHQSARRSDHADTLVIAKYLLVDAEAALLDAIRILQRHDDDLFADNDN